MRPDSFPPGCRDQDAVRSRPQACRVSLWWMPVGEQDRWEPLSQLLDAEERCRAGRFHFDSDRASYIAAHALGRVLLSSWHTAPPQAWRFSQNIYGKPEVSQPVTEPRLRLNISHCRGLAAAALCLGHDIGVDVEQMDDHIDHFSLAERYFATPEATYLKTLRRDERCVAFYRLWTLKEAYVKALGQGLSCALDGFELALNPARVVTGHSAQDGTSCWSLGSYQPSPFHLMALALRLLPGHLSPVVEKQRWNANVLLEAGLRTVSGAINLMT